MQMSLHFLLRAIIFFVGGAAFALAGVYFFIPRDNKPILGNQNISPIELDGFIRDKIQKEEGKTIDSLKKTFLEKILPAATENPIVQPVLNTHKEITSTVDTVKNLPQDQINAVCRQVCGQ